MNVNALEKLIQLMPDGEQKMALLKKVKQLSAENKSPLNGLRDEFGFEPKGAIKIEKILENGDSELVLEKDNLVVKGAEEILIKAFSGDPTQILYKVRKPKQSIESTAYFGKRVSPKYEFTKSLISVDDPDVSTKKLANDPLDYWACVNDSDFEITYSYVPVIMYVKEVESSIPGRKAFRICEKIDTSTFSGSDINEFIPIVSEIHSTHTAMFIGIGDGKAKERSLKDAAFTYTGTWTDAEVLGVYQKTSGSAGAGVSFTQKCNYVKAVFESGGSVDVYINNAKTQTIDTSLTQVVELNAFDNANYETEYKVELKQSGATPIVLSHLYADFLLEGDNFLFRELQDLETHFETPFSYKTTITPPYVISLGKFPIVDGTLSISVGGEAFNAVSSRSDLVDGAYFADLLTGEIEFNRALTGISATFDVTGQELIHAEFGSTPYFKFQNTLEKDSTKIGKSSTTYFAIMPFVLSTDLTKHHIFANGTEMEYVATEADVTDGKYTIVNGNKLVVAKNDAAGITQTVFDFYVLPASNAGYKTNYNRYVVEKPKAAGYPWYSLDKGSVSFVAEFFEQVPNYNVTIREMMLTNGPRVTDQIKGFKEYAVKAFSIVRVPEVVKDANTGLRITWTITLYNKNNQPYEGGF